MFDGYFHTKDISVQVWKSFAGGNILYLTTFAISCIGIFEEFFHFDFCLFFCEFVVLRKYSVSATICFISRDYIFFDRNLVVLGGLIHCEYWKLFGDIKLVLYTYFTSSLQVWLFEAIYIIEIFVIGESTSGISTLTIHMHTGFFSPFAHCRDLVFPKIRCSQGSNETRKLK